MSEEFETIIGLEVHVQLQTKTKMFTGATHQFGREPNSQVDVVSMGLPGSLPVINDVAVTLAVKAGLAIEAKIHNFSKFDRKHYFYPDSPRGYQITQMDDPYCTDGSVEIELNDGSKKVIGVTRIHMEDDAGKLVHQSTYSEVDLNRAGTPLCEIVSEPDMRHSSEAYAYLVELKRLMKYAGVSDCEMQEGSLRCDANVSIRPYGQKEFGTKVEVKNLNSFRAVEAAINYEVQNQTALKKAGRYDDEVKQVTKLWDPDNKVTKDMRGKEGAADYRYFPEPDLPPLFISDERVQEIKATMPEMPKARLDRFVKEYAITEKVALELIDEQATADYFEALIECKVSAKLAANWTREEALRLAAMKHLPLNEAAPIEKMSAVIILVDEEKVARVIAKAECDALFDCDETAGEYFTSRGMIQEQDDDQLAAWVAQAIEENQKVVDDIKGGKLAAAGRLVGACMKISGGKANPKAVKPEVFKQLGVEE
ncbi:MAG: Asp-tRNA(Asn)/Glu-tRNA(Gln) amidotransferase subunit GatB [Planctomycetes bacterium]|nr:Asp-tRNA(Asn)/Glu-tRNA(Gln) amidotransferase subunit GatB [Planctomycetota bacterium]